MEFFTVYFVGIIVLFLLLALLAGLAGESNPSILGPVGVIIAIWPIAILIAPFVGLWYLGNWIRKRIN